MQVRVEDIQAFLRTAHVRSFRGAAAELNITQSALSRRLQKLESALGARLLDRTSRTVHLTVVGREFLPTAKRMLLEFENSLGEIRDMIEKRAGSIVVASNMTVANTALPVMIKRFNEEHSGIQIRTIEDSTPAVVDAVASGEADFGIASSANNRQGIEFLPLVVDEVVLVARPDHPLASKRRARWADIADGEFIAMRRSSGTYHLLSAVLDDFNLLQSAKFRVSHAATLLCLINSGLGISALPRLGAMSRPDLDLAFRELVEPKISRAIGIVRREGRTLSPNAAALCDIAKEVLREYCKPVEDIRQADRPGNKSKPNQKNQRSKK